ncbi:hypothetical protein ACU4I5_26870 (plasmid) [Ensifer adhaerens]
MTKESKPDRLRQMGALNPKPEGVRAPGSGKQVSLIHSISCK